MVYFVERQPRFLQAIANRQSGKSGSVFDAVESLLLDRGNQLAVAHDRRRSVAVIRIDSEDIHSVKAVYRREADRARRGYKCRRHHSFKTYSDQGRDQEVLPARNALHTSRTPWLCRCAPSGGAISAKLASSRGRNGPRSQSSHGKVNVRFGRDNISGGRISLSASTSRPLCVPSR